MQEAGKDKRTLLNLRRAIERAGPMEKAIMRYLARQCSEEQLRPVDETLGRLNQQEPGDAKKKGPGKG